MQFRLAQKEFTSLRELQENAASYRHDMRHHIHLLQALAENGKLEEIPETKDRIINLRLFSKNNKLCIDIRNRYYSEVKFKDDLPLTEKDGHGFGTKSMVNIVEKHGGVYQFSVKDGWFLFQATA
ncbi:MAG: GHKL domain-containing protein [Eubacteriales bacterium]|nr:GHKL domain-containing protein [Eubacteriales bacterium]